MSYLQPTWQVKPQATTEGEGVQVGLESLGAGSTRLGPRRQACRLATARAASMNACTTGRRAPGAQAREMTACSASGTST